MLNSTNTRKISSRKIQKNLTPVFGTKKTCFGILSIIKQILTNVLFDDLSSFNNGVLPNRKSLPKKKKKANLIYEKSRNLFYQVEQQDLHKHQTKKNVNVHL